jgi:adenylate cyclase
LRLEMLCSSLESTGVTSLKPPETALLERMKQREGEVTDRFLVNFVEHQISRIEVSRTRHSENHGFLEQKLTQHSPL